MSLPFAESAKTLSSTMYPDNVVVLGVPGFGGVGIQITGPFVGTLQFESSLDGVTFGAHSVTPPNSTTAVTSATATGRWSAGCTAKFFQVRMSAFTSGAASVTLIGIPNGSSSGGGGGGGGGDASAANQLLEIADLDKLVAQILDGDTSGGTANTVGFATLLPASGGPVWGGTTTNPFIVASGLNYKGFDAIVPAFASTTDTYVCKTGGTSGSTVQTVVVTWTDSTKTVLSSVVRT